MKVTKLYVSQYGGRYYAKTLKDLKAKVGGGSVSIMYTDKKDGSTVKSGYVIGNLWLTAYVPFEVKA